MTEKFQRANIVKSKRRVINNNFHNHTKPNEKGTKEDIKYLGTSFESRVDS